MTLSKRIHQLFYIMFLSILLLVFSYTHCLAADKNGVSPNTISLPSGPGSIEGLGKSFQPTLNTGTASYQVEIDMPDGVAGHTPSLTLSYDSGLGDGPAGIGWSFGAGSVRRRTEKGIPRYVDGPNGEDDDHDGEYDEADEVDKFMGTEGEELVPLADSTYRARIEGTFIRYRRINNHWEAHLKSGTKLEFGLSPDARVTDESGAKIYQWLIEKSTDTNGNVIEFKYTAFPGSNNRKYLREISYGPGASPWTAFYFAFFTYEDRPDWRKDYRSGFKIKTTKRLTQIDIGIQGVLPDQCKVGDWNSDSQEDALIRRYTLSYDENIPSWSYLAKVTKYGADGVTFLPPISFSYTTFEPQPSVSAEGAMIKSTNEPFVNVMDSQLVELIDLNRDGLPDLLKTDKYGGSHTCYRNLGLHQGENGRIIKFDYGQTVTSPDGQASLLGLTQNQVHLADMDGDGISDLVHTTPLTGQVYYFLNQGDLSWTRRKSMSIQDSPPPAPFGNNQVKTSDLDFNKKIDIVKSSEYGGYSVWFNLGQSKYSREVRTNGAVHDGRNILFSDPGVQLADINGDRLNDVVKITPMQIIYCANMGHGHFDTSVSIDIPDQILTGGPNGQIAKAQLQDINGDGLSDLVIERAGENELWYWLNLGTDALSRQYRVTNIPTSYSSTMVTRWADLNGNGTKDLIYADSYATPKLRALDIGELVGGSAHPNMLSTIDNGLGVITTIHYRSSTEYYLEAEQEGKPWSSRLPFPVPVVSSQETTTSLDLDTIPGDDIYHKHYIYRDGYYDEIEKAFRGFATATVIEPGDASAPMQVTKHHFFTGGPDDVDNDGDGQVDEVSPEGFREEEPLKGLNRVLEIRSEDDILFNKVENDWLVKTLLTNPDGIEVRFAYTQEKRTLIYEGTDTPEILKTTYAYDDFGNVIEKKNYGALSLSGDEVFTYNTLINNTEKWILGLISRQYTTDSNGQKVAESFNYYDGKAYEGLDLGLVEKGNLTRQESWVAGDKYITLVRNSFDSYGNIIGIKDGNNNLREVEYDPIFHRFPITETIHINDIQKLIFTAEYNLGLGIPIKSIGFNGHVTRFYYDSVGYLLKIVKPGDSFTYPTQSFAYSIADPYHGLLYTYDEEGGFAFKSSVIKVSATITKLRERFCEPDTFDSIQYTDGLGRKLAVVEEAEEGFVVHEGVLFNKSGKILHTFLPYRVSTCDYQQPSLSIPHDEIQYDVTGREIIQIHPSDEDGFITQASTQYLPLKKINTDENNNTTTFIQDGLGRLVEVHEINNNEKYITRYEYNTLGNLTKVTDAQNNIKTMYYDGLKRRTKVLDPDCGQTLYEYDDAGNLIKTTDNKGQVILYTYDGANRILTEDYLDGAELTPDVTYHYDLASSDYPEASNLKGALSWVKDLSGAHFFSYDDRRNSIWQVKRIDQEGGISSDFKTSQAYDAMGRIISLTYPDGYVVDYIYNKGNFLESIPGLVKDIDSHPSKQIASIIFGNSVKTLYKYDPQLRLTHLQTKSILKENKILQDLKYKFDGVDNIIAIIDGRYLSADSLQNASQTFKYDGLYRLTQAEGRYGIINYQYDQINNMVQKKSPDASNPQHIDNALINLGKISNGGAGGTSNRLGRLPGDPPGPHAVTSTESGLYYDYDDNGNMISNADGALYTWDFRNRLLRVQNKSNDAFYVYDYTGQRVIKTVKNGSKKKVTLYINNVYEIRDGQTIKYIFAGNKRVARIDGDITGSEDLRQQTLNFSSGWNFFSLEAEPDDPAIEMVLGPIEDKFTAIWAFAPEINDYLGYVPDRKMYNLSELHAHRGYLINVPAPTTMIVAGEEISEDVMLNIGWNFIACPTHTDMLVEEALAPIAGTYRSVWSYDTINRQWKSFNPNLPTFMNNLKIMEHGKAYWVEMCEEKQLTYTNKPTGKIYFYHPDHLGSSNLITDMNGGVVEETQFYPFGMIRHEERAGLESIYKFSGKERDTESGLDYFGARYYLPIVGKFISTDPVEGELNNPQGFNRYAYVVNNPIKYVDPYGLQHKKQAQKAWLRKECYKLIKSVRVVRDRSDDQATEQFWGGFLGVSGLFIVGAVGAEMHWTLAILPGASIGYYTGDFIEAYRKQPPLTKFLTSELESEIAYRNRICSEAGAKTSGERKKLESEVGQKIFFDRLKKGWNDLKKAFKEAASADAPISLYEHSPSLYDSILKKAPGSKIKKEQDNKNSLDTFKALSYKLLDIYEKARTEMERQKNLSERTENQLIPLDTTGQ